MLDPRRSSTSFVSPPPSPPSRSAVASVRSTRSRGMPPVVHRGAQTKFGPLQFAARVTDVRFTRDRQPNVLPIAARSAFHPHGSADAPVNTTPVAPPASADRMIAPALPGSCTSTATTTSAGDGVSTCVSVDRRAVASATTPLGVRTGRARPSPRATRSRHVACATSCWSKLRSAASCGASIMAIVDDLETGLGRRRGAGASRR